MTVAVVGAGVTGLTTAIELLKAGYSVDVFTRDELNGTTSSVAAAWWFCYKAFPVERTHEWSRSSFEESAKLYLVADSGVTPVRFIQYFTNAGPAPTWGTIPGDGKFVQQSELPRGYAAGYSATVPLMDSTRYLPYLLKEVLRLGGSRHTADFRSMEDLPPLYRVVVNCAGVWSSAFTCDSDLHPVKGQAIRLKKIPEIRSIMTDADGPNAPIFIVPRSDDCLVGGTYEENRWTVDAPSVEDIMSRARRLTPFLDRAEILDARAGLRPGRSSVRLDAEIAPDGRLIVHNYGHGGAGFTLSWGCAKEAAALVGSAAV